MAIPFEKGELEAQELKLTVRSLADIMEDAAEELEQRYKTDVGIVQMINEFRMSAQVARDKIRGKNKKDTG